MASGIPYVPLDCHFDDDKFPMIEAEFGLEGFAIVVKLLQKIYGGLGYYCEWNDRVALLFARNIGAGGNVVREVVSAAIREGIFDKGMFEKYGVLTSHGIQKRFCNIAKRRKKIFDKPEYVLVCYEDFSGDVDISGENVCNSGENVCNSETSKVKVSKDKLSEEKQSSQPPADAASAACTKDDLIKQYGIIAVEEYEKRFCKWQEKNRAVRAEMYSTIAKWMKQDGIVKPPSRAPGSSLDMDEVFQELRKQYQ